MRLKDLRDYLNGLNLDEVQSYVDVVYVTDDGCVCDGLADFSLSVPEGNKPYLSLYCESFISDMEKLDGGIHA